MTKHRSNDNFRQIHPSETLLRILLDFRVLQNNLNGYYVSRYLKSPYTEGYGQG